MTRERTAELLPVMEAFAKGTPIQWSAGGGNEWHDDVCPQFHINSLDWRIKPQPRERWIVVWASGNEYLFVDPDALDRHKRDYRCHIKEIYRVEEKE